MRVNITYVASSGNTYNLIADGIRHKEANYHTWSWEAVGTKLQYGYRIAEFSRDAAVYETELIFYGTEADRRPLINAIHDDFESDIRNQTAGKLIWGDYYLNCYITTSETSATDYMGQTRNAITIYAPYPFWVQDVHISLYKSSEASASSFLDYEYDYSYDYTAPPIGTKIIKSSFPFSSEFKMVIYGLAVNPRIVINDYPYLLSTTIPQGAYVIVDSRSKSIMQYNTDGTRTNVFNYRNKSDSIFEKVPGGNLEITWDASFGVDLTIYHERSEPRIEEG